VSDPVPPSETEADPHYGQPPAQFSEPGTQAAPPTVPAVPPVPAVPARPPVRVGFGAVLASCGLIAVMLAFTTLAWFDKASAKFPEIHARLSDRSRYYNGWAQAYFGWLGWLLVAAVFLLACIANTSVRWSRWSRVAGAVLAAAAIGLTFRALNLFINSVPTYSDYLGHARSGFYTALAGFLVMGVGAAIGRPRR
jgi:hypothetical protein